MFSRCPRLRQPHYPWRHRSRLPDQLITHELASVREMCYMSWTDPKVVSALGMWLVFAILLHARFRPAMRGRSVMVLTIVAFAFLVFTWVGIEALRLPTAHGAARTAGRIP